MGGLLALISICVRSSWISSKLYEELHPYPHYDNFTKCETSCLLTVVGVMSSVISACIGIVRIRFCNVKNSKRFRAAQFVCLIAGFINLLSSVAV
ncbi:unnamed protein product [Heterobilharzia americana]|nr:unnamed protein product [Heterobilharzia americana]